MLTYTRDVLIERQANGETLKFLFFWGHRPAASGKVTKSCLSQWWDCQFTVDGMTYHTAEQYMMAQKAVLFGDKTVLAKIMAAGNPAVYKKLGREIRGFDPVIWAKHNTDIVVAGNLAKFSQNPELLEFLLHTGDRILVEASPKDRIWGIGLGERDAAASSPKDWQGTNLLGFSLMEVRDRLKK